MPPRRPACCWRGRRLRLSWGALGTIGRGLVWSNAVAMLGVMGWLYLVAPQRVCTSYLLSDQDLLGHGLLAADALLAAALVVRAFLGGPPMADARPLGAAPERGGEARRTHAEGANARRHA